MKNSENEQMKHLDNTEANYEEDWLDRLTRQALQDAAERVKAQKDAEKGLAEKTEEEMSLFELMQKLEEVKAVKKRGG